MATSGPQVTKERPLADLAAQLKDIGVDIYSVGIGPNVIPSELETIASRPDNVFRTQTTSLPILASQLNGMIRQGMFLLHLLPLIILDCPGLLVFFLLFLFLSFKVVIPSTAANYMNLTGNGHIVGFKNKPPKCLQNMLCFLRKNINLCYCICHFFNWKLKDLE